MHKSGKTPNKKSLSNERQATCSLNSPIVRSQGPKMRASLCILKKASLTVEAAVMIPLFFLCGLCMISIMDVYPQTLEKLIAMRNQSQQAALYASAADAEGWIDLQEMFAFQPVFAPSGISLQSIVCRGCARIWSGRDPQEYETGSFTAADTYVYVTEHESVYHTSASCTHLELSVRAVASGALASARNEAGGRYGACEKCVGDGSAAAVVYITDEGDCYHNSSSCSGLKRTVTMKSRQQTQGLRECERCASQTS